MRRQKILLKGSVVAEIYQNDNQNTMVVDAQITSEKNDRNKSWYANINEIR